MAAVTFIAGGITATSAHAAAKSELLFAGELEKTEGITICPNGTIYVTENKRGTIYKIDIKSNTLLKIADGLAGAAGMACSRDNRAVALDYSGNKVVEIQPDGKSIRKLADVTTPNGAVFMADGTLLVSQSDAGSVVKITKDGEVEPVVTGIPFANGLALSPDERTLFVSATIKSKVYTVDLSGTTAAPVQFGKLVQMVDGIAYAKDGTVVACQYGTGKVVRLAAGAEKNVTIADGLKGPASPVFADDSTLLVTSVTGVGIYKITIE